MGSDGGVPIGKVRERRRWCARWRPTSVVATTFEGYPSIEGGPARADDSAPMIHLCRIHERRFNVILNDNSGSSTGRTTDAPWAVTISTVPVVPQAPD
jgi:hypothetical protein